MMEVNPIQSAGIPPAQVKHGKSAAGRGTSRPVREASPSPSLPVKDADIAAFTSDEKKYFASAFPFAAREIHQHSVYQKNGARPPIALGTVVDRKG